jgi:hypothetical protein
VWQPVRHGGERGGGVAVVVVVGCKIGGMEREVRVGTRIWVEARTLTHPYVKTLIFGGVSLNKFEISRGVCYIQVHVHNISDSGVSYIIAENFTYKIDGTGQPHSYSDYSYKDMESRLYPHAIIFFNV